MNLSSITRLARWQRIGAVQVSHERIWPPPDPSLLLVSESDLLANRPLFDRVILDEWANLASFWTSPSPPCEQEWAFGVPIQKQNEKLSMSEPSINQNHLRSMCSMPELPSLVELFPSPLHVHWLFQYIQYILFNIYVSSHLWLANVDICNKIILALSCRDSTALIDEGARGAKSSTMF